MRFRLAVLLLAAAFLACVDSTSDESAFKTIIHSFSENQNIVPTHRFLRTDDVAVENGEERTGLRRVVDALKAGTSNFVGAAKLKKYLSKRKSGVDVLNKLKLGDDAE
ncbi:hypothetical protein PI124_g15744 [Phytophthora idaei]|nr:hypothetical protein PI125_g15882 [Phytophthora idaei]KAG3143169.1 hypothetical protein PI126_g14747 [Phytophthora idaei]KAG3239324.1 hypothetical protein PI124_g15744 [Phytophthora idaei]